MDWTIHKKLTEDPNSTLPTGEAECSVKDIIFLKVPLRDIGNQLAFKIYRKKSHDGKLYDAKLENSKGSMQLLKLIKEKIVRAQEEKTTVAVLAPWKEDKTLSKSEGYIRRIKEIDETVLKDFFCIYLYECPYYQVNRPVVDLVSENRLYIRYNTDYLFQRQFVEHVIALCDWCYSHSVLRLIPAFHPEHEDRWLNVFQRDVKHILDLHGATEEEALILGETDCISYIRKAEGLYFRHIKYAISLTENMERYFSDKYQRSDIVYYRTPVISQDIKNQETLVKSAQKPLIAVYSGGCQKWQNIQLMIKIIKRNLKNVEYHIFVSEPDKFRDIWGDEPVPENVIYKNGTPEEIISVYRSAHIGFILRDDNNLNRVACPTKLMEYLQFGIVPVVMFNDIGGMAELGMKSISWETDLTETNNTALESFASDNFHIVNQLLQQNKDNIYNLVQLLQKGIDS